MKIILILSILFFIGCQKHHEDEEHQTEGPRYEEINMSRAASDAKLPSSLWEEFEGLYKPLVLDQSTTAEEGVKTKAKIPMEFFPFKVYMVEKSKDILNEKNYKLLFGSGGGTLDLKDFVNDRKGTFYFSVEHDLDLKTQDLSIFFLSDSKEKKFQSETFGSGCNTYMNISKYFNKQMSKHGIVVNTANQRHAALLTGTFFFVVSHQGKLHISQLTVKDSRYKSWSCKG